MSARKNGEGSFYTVNDNEKAQVEIALRLSNEVQKQKENQERIYKKHLADFAKDALRHLKNDSDGKNYWNAWLIKTQSDGWCMWYCLRFFLIMCLSSFDNTSNTHYSDAWKELITSLLQLQEKTNIFDIKPLFRYVRENFGDGTFDDIYGQAHEFMKLCCHLPPMFMQLVYVKVVTSDIEGNVKVLFEQGDIENCQFAVAVVHSNQEYDNGHYDMVICAPELVENKSYGGPRGIEELSCVAHNGQDEVETPQPMAAFNARQPAQENAWASGGPLLNEQARTHSWPPKKLPRLSSEQVRQQLPILMEMFPELDCYFLEAVMIRCHSLQQAINIIMNNMLPDGHCVIEGICLPSKVETPQPMAAFNASQPAQEQQCGSQSKPETWEGPPPMDQLVKSDCKNDLNKRVHPAHSDNEGLQVTHPFNDGPVTAPQPQKKMTQVNEHRKRRKIRRSKPRNQGKGKQRRRRRPWRRRRKNSKRKRRRHQVPIQVKNLQLKYQEDMLELAMNFEATCNKLALEQRDEEREIKRSMKNGSLNCIAHEINERLNGKGGQDDEKYGEDRRGGGGLFEGFVEFVTGILSNDDARDSNDSKDADDLQLQQLRHESELKLKLQEQQHNFDLQLKLLQKEHELEMAKLELKILKSNGGKASNKTDPSADKERSSTVFGDTGDTPAPASSSASTANLNSCDIINVPPGIKENKVLEWKMDQLLSCQLIEQGKTRGSKSNHYQTSRTYICAGQNVCKREECSSGAERAYSDRKQADRIKLQNERDPRSFCAVCSYEQQKPVARIHKPCPAKIVKVFNKQNKLIEIKQEIGHNHGPCRKIHRTSRENSAVDQGTLKQGIKGIFDQQNDPNNVFSVSALANRKARLSAQRNSNKQTKYNGLGLQAGLTKMKETHKNVNYELTAIDDGTVACVWDKDAPELLKKEKQSGKTPRGIVEDTTHLLTGKGKENIKLTVFLFKHSLSNKWVPLFAAFHVGFTVKLYTQMWKTFFELFGYPRAVDPGALYDGITVDFYQAPIHACLDLCNTRQKLLKPSAALIPPTHIFTGCLLHFRKCFKTKKIITAQGYARKTNHSKKRKSKQSNLCNAEDCADHGPNQCGAKHDEKTNGDKAVAAEPVAAAEPEVAAEPAVTAESEVAAEPQKKATTKKKKKRKRKYARFSVKKTSNKKKTKTPEPHESIKKTTEDKEKQKAGEAHGDRGKFWNAYNLFANKARDMQNQVYNGNYRKQLCQELNGLGEKLEEVIKAEYAENNEFLNWWTKTDKYGLRMLDLAIKRSQFTMYAESYTNPAEGFFGATKTDKSLSNLNSRGTPLLDRIELCVLLIGVKVNQAKNASNGKFVDGRGKEVLSEVKNFAAQQEVPAAATRRERRLRKNNYEEVFQFLLSTWINNGCWYDCWMAFLFLVHMENGFEFTDEALQFSIINTIGKLASEEQQQNKEFESRKDDWLQHMEGFRDMLNAYSSIMTDHTKTDAANRTRLNIQIKSLKQWMRKTARRYQFKQQIDEAVVDNDFTDRSNVASALPILMTLNNFEIFKIRSCDSLRQLQELPYHIKESPQDFTKIWKKAQADFDKLRMEDNGMEAWIDGRLDFFSCYTGNATSYEELVEEGKKAKEASRNRKQSVRIASQKSQTHSAGPSGSPKQSEATVLSDSDEPPKKKEQFKLEVTAAKKKDSPNRLAIGLPLHVLHLKGFTGPGKENLPFGSSQRVIPFKYSYHGFDYQLVAIIEQSRTHFRSKVYVSEFAGENICAKPGVFLADNLVNKGVAKRIGDLPLAKDGVMIEYKIEIKGNQFLPLYACYQRLKKSKPPVDAKMNEVSSHDDEADGTAFPPGNPIQTCDEDMDNDNSMFDQTSDNDADDHEIYDADDDDDDVRIDGKAGRKRQRTADEERQSGQKKRRTVAAESSTDTDEPDYEERRRISPTVIQVDPKEVIRSKFIDYFGKHMKSSGNRRFENWHNLIDYTKERRNPAPCLNSNVATTLHDAFKSCDLTYAYEIYRTDHAEQIRTNKSSVPNWSSLKHKATKLLGERFDATERAELNTLLRKADYPCYDDLMKETEEDEHLIELKWHVQNWDKNCFSSNSSHKFGTDDNFDAVSKYLYYLSCESKLFDDTDDMRLMTCLKFIDAFIEEYESRIQECDGNGKFLDDLDPEKEDCMSDKFWGKRKKDSLPWRDSLFQFLKKKKDEREKALDEALSVSDDDDTSWKS